MFWDMEKDEKLIFHCFGFHRCKMDLSADLKYSALGG